ncbi:MAG: pilin [Candidatus Saccharibacteria bacterium]|nr:pilin [Candidatus Saccharibacteria bacterium]
MKHFLRNVVFVFALFFSLSFLANSLTAPKTFAAQPNTSNGNSLGSCRYLVGLVSWDCGIDPNPKTQNEITSNIIIIANNILSDLFVASAYVSLFFVIYGGYLYIFSRGEAGKVTNGKKTLINAFTGLAIVLLANVILNTVRIVLIGENGSFTNCLAKECVNPEDLIPKAIQWALNISAIVAAVFIVIAGISFITAYGDPGKITAARSAIIYACIGLVIIALAKILTAFVTNIIKDAKAFAPPSTTLIIAKEFPHEKNY